MFNSFAAASSSLSIMAVRSRLTRWIGGIIFPELVKKREMSFPRSARREMDSAEMGFCFLRVLFIEFPFLARGFPQRDQVIVFAFGIAPNLKNQGVHLVAHPANRAILFRQIGAHIQVVRMCEDFLPFFEPDATLWVCP